MTARELIIKLMEMNNLESEVFIPVANGWQEMDASNEPVTNLRITSEVFGSKIILEAD